MRRLPSLTSLRLFLQIARNGSFSETARNACVSQPVLSRTIRLLEEELEARLFDRDSRKVTLTIIGEQLVPIADRLISDFDQAFADLQPTFTGRRARIVVGALPSIAANVLPATIARFAVTHPLVDITVRDGLTGSLYQQMQERQIDLAITTPPHDDALFAFVPLLIDPCVLVFHETSAVPDGDPLPWSAFSERPFIAMAVNSSVRVLTDTAFIKAGVGVKPLYECAHLATVGGLIAAGLGISALPLSTVPMLNAPGLQWRRLEAPSVERTIGIACLAQRTLQPAAAAFRDMVQRIMLDQQS